MPFFTLNHDFKTWGWGSLPLAIYLFLDFFHGKNNENAEHSFAIFAVNFRHSCHYCHRFSCHFRHDGENGKKIAFFALCLPLIIFPQKLVAKMTISPHTFQLYLNHVVIGNISSIQFTINTGSCNGKVNQTLQKLTKCYKS